MDVPTGSALERVLIKAQRLGIDVEQAVAAEERRRADLEVRRRIQDATYDLERDYGPLDENAVADRVAAAAANFASQVRSLWKVDGMVFDADAVEDGIRFDMALQPLLTEIRQKLRPGQKIHVENAAGTAVYSVADIQDWDSGTRARVVRRGKRPFDAPREWDIEVASVGDELRLVEDRDSIRRQLNDLQSPELG
jgi:hypothetical protein